MAVSTTTSTSSVGAASISAIRKLFEEAMAIYAPGGEYMGGIEAQLARGQTRAVASGMQGLAAAGLAGTSMAGGLGKKYEEEVAAPALAQATSTRLSALAGLFQSQAGAEAQLAPRYTTQRTYTPSQESQWGIPSRPAVPTGTTSVASRPPAIQPTAQPTAQPAVSQPAPPSLNLGPSLPDPSGTWQATIGGVSYYSDGSGGFTQSGTPAPSAQTPAQLSSFYGSLTPSSYQPRDVYHAFQG